MQYTFILSPEQTKTTNGSRYIFRADSKSEAFAKATREYAHLLGYGGWQEDFSALRSGFNEFFWYECIFEKVDV